MIERICPASVTVVERADDMPEVVLFPEEFAAVAAAVDKRRREFAATRWCARTALARLGIDAAPIVSGPGGAPTWPAGVVGSLTHCDGLRAAAVAHATDVLTIGIDAEPDAPLPDGVFPLIARPADISVLPDGADVAWDRLLFCAKEAVYKAWYPLTRRFLGFEDAEVVLDLNGTFTARVLVQGPVTSYTGRWIADHGLLAAATSVAAGVRLP